MIKEDLINKFMYKLTGKIPDEYLSIIKQQLVITLGEYEIERSKHEITTINTDQCIEMLNLYLGCCKIEGLSDNTLKHYKDIDSKMLISINKPLKDITTNDIRLYLYKLQSLTNISNTTIENDRVAINAFFNWLLNNGYIDRNPAKLIKPIKCEIKEKEPINDLDMEKIRLCCRDIRERAIVEFLYSTGARVSEMCNTKVSDIDFVNREVKLFGKGKKHRVTYLNARSIIIIQEYLKERQIDSEYLFCNNKKPYGKLSTRWIEIIIKRLGKESGTEGKVYPHRFRRTMATDALNHGMPIEEVQKLLGHNSIDTTMIYAKINNDNLQSTHKNTII